MTRCRAGLIALALSLSSGLPAGAQEPSLPLADTTEPAPAAEEKPEEKTTHWVFLWDGWGGLRLGMTRKTKLKNPSYVYVLTQEGEEARPLFEFEKVGLTSQIGVKFAGDAAAFHTTGNLTGFDDGVALRRARLSLNGDWTLVLPLQYGIELGYTPNTFVLNEAWLRFPEVKFIGQTQGGQFQPPQGLDVINSSWAITFMEPAATLQALAPGTSAGIQIGQPVLSERATWRLGIFGNGLGGSDYGLVSKSYGSLIGRATWLPIQEGTSGEGSVPRFLHVGLSANFLLAPSETLRYQSRPESYIAPYVIDTGNMSANSAMTFGGEAAFVNGPFSLQAEILHSWVNRTAGDTVDFGGYYVSASWILTGESRPYDPYNAKLTFVSPRKDFNWKTKEWGAFELAGRYSFTNLTDKSVQGGRLNMLMGGLNWYLTRHIRWYVNAGWGRVTGTAYVGNLVVAQLRLAVFM
ncbi:MAG TPA: porin [Thermoanaerobaculia bacterium]|nr:porin [Thermoanaerobaculia bacterium]